MDNVAGEVNNVTSRANVASGTNVASGANVATMHLSERVTSCGLGNLASES